LCVHFKPAGFSKPDPGNFVIILVLYPKKDFIQTVNAFNSFVGLTRLAGRDWIKTVNLEYLQKYYSQLNVWKTHLGLFLY
jgi:hypothetical protein